MKPFCDLIGDLDFEVLGFEGDHVSGWGLGTRPWKTVC